LDWSSRVLQVGRRPFVVELCRSPTASALLDFGVKDNNFYQGEPLPYTVSHYWLPLRKLLSSKL